MGRGADRWVRPYRTVLERAVAGVRMAVEPGLTPAPWRSILPLRLRTNAAALRIVRRAAVVIAALTDVGSTGGPMSVAAATPGDHVTRHAPRPRRFPPRGQTSRRWPTPHSRWLRWLGNRPDRWGTRLASSRPDSTRRRSLGQIPLHRNRCHWRDDSYRCSAPTPADSTLHRPPRCSVRAGTR